MARGGGGGALADLPPTAAVAAADAGLDLKSLSLRIARDLDASVDRVARAARGERFVEPEPHRVPEALPSHPYPIVATPVAPVLPPLTQTETAAPAMTRAQTEQFEEQLRASRRLAERRERELGREARPREPPAYAFSEGDDAFGSGEAPTHAFGSPCLRVGNQKNRAARTGMSCVAREPRRLPPPPPAPPPPPFAPPPAPPPPFAFGAPRRVLTGNTPRAYVSDLVEQAYALAGRSRGKPARGSRASTPAVRRDTRRACGDDRVFLAMNIALLSKSAVRGS